MKRLCLLLILTTLVSDKDWAQISATTLSTSPKSSDVNSVIQVGIKALPTPK